MTRKTLDEGIKSIPKEQIAVARDVLAKLEQSGIPIQKMTGGELFQRFDTNLNKSDGKYVMDVISKHQELENKDEFDFVLGKTNITPEANVALDMIKTHYELLKSDVYRIERRQLCRQLGLTTEEYNKLKANVKEKIKFNGSEEIVMKLDNDLLTKTEMLLKEQYEPCMKFPIAYMRGAPSVKGLARWDFKEMIVAERMPYLHAKDKDDHESPREKVSEAMR